MNIASAKSATFKISANSRLLAIDPSLTASGWALFSFKNKKPINVGVISPPGSKYPLANRLEVLQNLVEKLFNQLKINSSDVLVCEGPAPLVINPQSSLKVENVRGLFEYSARARGAIVPGRVNPRTVQVEVLGMWGKQLPRRTVKIWARETVTRLYGNGLINSVLNRDANEDESRSGVRLSQDIIDALLIGTYAVSQVELADRANLDLYTQFQAAQRGRKRNSRSRGLAWPQRDARRMLANRFKGNSG